ncbi:MAG: hypothetical protein NC184_04590 [Roseburia sp.]|nr:hypothetical protein [Roseburia sp.]
MVDKNEKTTSAVATSRRIRSRGIAAVVAILATALLCAVLLALPQRSNGASAETRDGSPDTCFAESPDHSGATEITAATTTLSAGDYYLNGDVLLTGGGYNN